MRRLLAWGRQDPQCPAEAASPPPLSAFHSPSSVLPTPSKLFSDIERQLSARIAAEPLLRSAQPQPSPPTEAASERTSPPEPTPTHSAATDTAFQKAAITDFEHQLQQQQQQQQNAGPNVPTVRQSQPKGIDAFFAALANANRDNGGAAASSTASSVPCQQQQPQQQTKIPFFESEQTNPRHKSFAQQPSVVARMSSDLCPPLITQQQPFTTQPLAQKVQQQMTNNELAANLLVNAIAAQQQQNEMRPSMELLANLKTSHQSTAASHQPLSPLNSPLANSQNASVAGSAALNAFQLVQQTAQFNQQKMLVEQQQRQLISAATMALKSPLSPQGAVFTCSEVGFPGLLNRLPSVPTMFCSSVGPGPSQSKPIPLLDERVDLIQFKRKEPREWSSDDVVAWILDVARRHQIPCENLNLAKFASCTGPLLMLMNEQSFKEHDPNYGSLLFSEFCKLVTDENFIDEWMKANGISAAAGTSSTSNQSMMAQIDLKKPAVPSNLLQQTALLGQFALQQEKHQRLLLADSVAGIDRPMDAAASVAAGTSTANLLLNAVVAAANGQQQKNAGGCAVLSPLNQLLLPAPSAQQQEKPQHSPVAPLQAQSAIASLSQMVQPIQQQQPHQTSAINGGTATALMDQPQHHLPTGTLNLATPQRPQQQHFLKSNTGEGVKRGVGRPAGSKNKVEKQIKRNKDGRPRKRSQHTKGNKLWEFIRDALKDPRTCPSVVRWEDPSEGVFRIVESERLAFLWGQKKNNQKMTYEKLSRAMRTYYEKEILVPVPKSGLYPKKLVYKFGPTAHGWRAAASLAIQAHLALIGGQRISM